MIVVSTNFSKHTLCHHYRVIHCGYRYLRSTVSVHLEDLIEHTFLNPLKHDHRWLILPLAHVHGYISLQKAPLLLLLSGYLVY